MAIIGVDVLMKKFGNSDYIERISGEESIRYVANIPLRKFGVEAIKAFVTKTMEYQLRPMKTTKSIGRREILFIVSVLT